MTSIPIPRRLGALAALTLVAAAAAAATPAAAVDAALAAAMRQEAARAPAPRLSRAQMLAPTPLADVALSPDGRQVAYLQNAGEQRRLWLLAVDTDAPRLRLAHTDARQLDWSRDGRWLFLTGDRAVASFEVATGTGVRIPLDGPTPRQPLQIDPSQPAAVVLRESVPRATPARWRIVRFDARGQRTPLREDTRWIQDLVLGADGHLAYLMRSDGRNDMVIERVRPDGGTATLMRWQHQESGSLLSATADGALYLRSDVDGDLKRVLRLDADGTRHTVHVDPRGESDLDAVVLDPRSGEPRVVTYRSTVAAAYGLGPAQAPVAALRARFPDAALDVRVADGADARWLVNVKGDAPDPLRYLYDPRRDTLRPLPMPPDATARPAAAYARKLPIDYTASDGLRVHGFLLLPAGHDPATLPLVAVVHGGPFSHNAPGYDRYDGIAQFLANRGYAVFEPNFRGSTGLGRAYRLAAHGDYGNGRVQQDVIDGVRWLLAQGVGDCDRVGIVGHSYGGYAALLGVTFAPELFRVAVAGSPPADFGWLSRWNVDDGVLGQLPGESLEAMLRGNGIDVHDPAVIARLSAQSPQANAARVQRPIALLAGGRDERVPIRAVTHYAATLAALGKPVTLMVEPEGAHSPLDPLPREAYLYLTEAMLHRYLGGPAPEPAAAPLRAYLHDNLRRLDRGLAPLP